MCGDDVMLGGEEAWMVIAKLLLLSNLMVTLTLFFMAHPKYSMFEGSLDV